VNARRLGLSSAVACVLLILVYAATLAVGLGSLPSLQEPIGDPYFSLLEILIIVLMLPMVALMCAVHAWAPADVKVFSQLAVVFMSLLAGVTGCVHFVILTVGHAAVDAGVPGMSFLLSFAWPSVTYALDILAWDVFFALAVLFAAPAFHGGGLARWIRAMLITSGALALAGLGGVAANDMRWRFIGIAGYVVVFPVAVGLMALLFRVTPPRQRDAIVQRTPRE
jgi:hypothetical protein